MLTRPNLKLILSFSLSLFTAAAVAEESFDAFLKPLFAENCVRCHGGEKLKGKINLKELSTAQQLLAKPDLIKEVIEAVDGFDMPPEDEPELDEQTRIKLLATLKDMLRESAANDPAVAELPLRRLNRFQYNNSVRDLFQLNRDVFALPEKLMTRRNNYLLRAADKLPDTVQVSCESLDPAPGLTDVEAFPKDLRAAHGFDNQANQLTLSPLLLDSFLTLSVSILESPDFNEKTVGIWNEFFAEPAALSDLEAEVRQRLEPFMTQAFRGPVEPATLDRYAAYVAEKIENGSSFTESMKKGAAAILSSPMFLYRHPGENDQYELASRLSYFIWGSSPDAELLRLAESGELANPEALNQTIDRMLADPKVERFLDTFPAQWMQLENALAATPDPRKALLFNVDPRKPASTQMILEPLLLFDAVFVENRPVIDLIAPDFGYRSEFLQTWYNTDLKPPKFDAEQLARENQAKDDERAKLTIEIDTVRADLSTLVDPIRTRLLANRKDGSEEPVDLKPVAAWEFDDNLEDSVGSLHLTAKGDITFEKGSVVLKKSFLQSQQLPIDLKAKTFEIWFRLPRLDQRGGGLMGVQEGKFDTIVLGERKPQHWISGSNGFQRTEDFPSSTPEEAIDELIHLVMVYEEDGTTRLYRNGEAYGESYQKGSAVFQKGKATILFGLRHLPPGGNRFLEVSIDRARLYDRALTTDEVGQASTGNNFYVPNKEVIAAMTTEQQAKHEVLKQAIADSRAALKRVPPNLELGKAKQEAVNRFEQQIRAKINNFAFRRVPADDPRYGGIITNAALATMTSGPGRTHPIARGAWMIEVIFNDPPPPPPNDVPPLDEDEGAGHLTIREQFARHRENPDCAGCHARLDPLGFALENFDITGRWRDRYDNGREVDMAGVLLKKYEFASVVDFKAALVKEDRRFAKALTAHLLRFALARELSAADSLVVDSIVEKTEAENFRFKAIMREVILSEPFSRIKK
ncbi:MAG: hypothetical protein ACI8UO_002333 [Verrucomicrobiales bacterium]|jgi:hypothetical protein